jgi:hypothetical protein
MANMMASVQNSPAYQGFRIRFPRGVADAADNVTTYYRRDGEDLRKVVGASGQEVPLKSGSIQPPPAPPALDDNVPSLAVPVGGQPPSQAAGEARHASQGI